MALSKERPGSLRFVKRDKRPVAANVKCWKGGLVACDSSGYFRPQRGTETDVNVGARFTETVDNTGGANGAKMVEIEYFREKELFLAENDTDTPVDVADRERPCYALDDETVTADDENSFAGIVYDVTSEGVWLDGSAGPRGPQGPQGPQGDPG